MMLSLQTFLARAVSMTLALTLTAFGPLGCQDSVQGSGRSPDAARQGHTPGEFVKPSHDFRHEDFFRDDIDADQMMFDQGVFSNWQGRRHMHSTENSTTHWLYEGEYFVLDGYHALFGPDQTQEFRMVVLVDFQKVPFRLQPVESADEYPEMSEIEHMTDSFATSASFELVSGEPFNYTLIIPPSSFGEVGAHDVRMVYFRQFSPRPDRTRAFDSFQKSLAMTVYYNGTEFVDSARDLSDTSLVAQSNETIGYLTHSMSGPLLAPPEDVYDTAELQYGSEVRLAQVFSSHGESSMHVSGYAFSVLPVTEPERNYFMLFDGVTPLDEQSGAAITEPKPDEVQTTESYLQRLRFDVPLNDDQIHRVTLMQFPRPFVKFDEVPHASVGERWSNTLFLTRGDNEQ